MQIKQNKDEFFFLDIDRIDINDNRELDEGNVIRLMKSIDSVGQLMPILVSEIDPETTHDIENYKWKLIAGGHRLEACKRLGYTQTKGVLYAGEDEKRARLHENTMRSNLSFQQKIEAAKWVQETLANPTGKHLNRDDGDGCQKLGKHTDDLVVENGIFTNKETFRQAIKIYEECIPEVYSLIDAGAISVYYAYSNIVPVPKKKQKSLLYDIGVDASIDRTMVRNKIKERLKKQRKEDAGIPENPDAHPIYNVVRVSPDWQNELHSDIRELPVNDYLSDVGVLFLECPNREVAAALELITKWGLTYQAIITVYNQKSPTEKSVKGLPVPWYISQKSYHILIAQKDPELCGPTVEDIPAVLNRQKPEESLFNIVSEICPIEKELRLDMSGTVPVDGWKVWKIDYAKKD